MFEETRALFWTESDRFAEEILEPFVRFVVHDERYGGAESSNASVIL
jgi:hypothetical protein